VTLADVARQASTFVHANGIDIHYAEIGQGVPLVLVHGGMVSSNPIWTHAPVAYAAHMHDLASRYRVIAPDTRGCGKTVHDHGAISFDRLADDLLALIDALGLDRPLVAGFSEGGITATIAGIKRPDGFRAIVNDAGYDMFDPAAPSFTMMRQMLGGNASATEADPDAFAQMCAQSEQMAAMFELMKADQDGGQGEGHWADYLRLAFHRTTRPTGYTYEDFAKITAPTLIVVGDRDEFCTLGEAVIAFGKLQQGELAVLPGTGHVISPGKVDATVDFFERRLHEN
jgi:pimeloyl-ACP methyl ester carboxylesterase